MYFTIFTNALGKLGANVRVCVQNIELLNCKLKINVQREDMQKNELQKNMFNLLTDTVFIFKNTQPIHELSVQ